MGAAAALLWLLLIIAVCQSIVRSQGTRPLACPRGVITASGGTRDWSLRYAKCYLAVFEAQSTWEEASKMCQRYGGQLAEPAGFRLTEEVGAIATASDPALTQVWIGYNRRGYTGDMTQGLWADGRSALADAGVWGPQEPNIQAGDCAYMERGAGTSWTWHLGGCDVDRAFICQTTPCPDDTFRCDNGHCVGTSNVCNEENNCRDGSDERHCTDKCSYLITDKQGTLRYPSTGSDYLPTKTCQWVIEGTVGSRLQLQFVSLNTEKGVDFVEIWVGGSTLTSSTLLRRLSGTSASGLIVSTNNVAIVRFLSDDSYHDRGFHLTWQSEFQCSMVETVGLAADDNEVAVSEQALDAAMCGVRCGSDTQCVAYVYNRFTGICYRYNSMPKPKDAACCTYYVKTCPGYNSMLNLPSVPGDGGHLYATSTLQRFHSVLYPLPYLGDTVTTWVIHSPGRQLVQLHILDLDLAVGDIISIFDGSTTEAPVLATMTGSDVNALSLMTADDQRFLLSTQSTMLVHFTSLRQSNSRGFLFEYKAGCQFELSGSTGRICSPGYQLDLYPNIVQCSWVIQVPAGRTLTLTFDQNFSLESGKDFLKVIADGSPKHTGSGYTGNIAPQSVLAQNGRVEVSMVTGATGRARGFSTQFNAGCATIQDPTLALNSYTANYGESITVQCASEYVLTGIYTNLNQVGIFCQEGGRWTKDPFPTCKRVYCGPPSDINNGYLVSVTGPYSGDTATYACETGFQLSTNVLIKCRNSGFWDARPFCFSLRSCPTIQDPFQGRALVVAGNGYDHGSVVNFTCINPLYELQGSANLLCQNGNWSDTFPTCERIPCAVPHVDNGTVMPLVNVVQGQTLSVVCNPGFVLTGSATFNCNDSSSVPACVNVDECRSGSGCSQDCVDTVGSYYCTCGPGYQLLSDWRTCSDLDECSLNRGNCDGICINSPGSYRCECVGNSQLFTSNGQFGITIPASETGLEPWNIYHLNHTCIQMPTVVCPVPPQSISNGYLMGETGTFTVGQSITYLCNLGYDTNDQTTLICQSNGNWSTSVPVCSVASCPEPVIALGNVTSQTPIRYLDYVTVTCDLLGIKSSKKARCMWDSILMAYRVDTNLLRCDVTGVDCGIPTRLPGSLPYSLSSTAYSAQFTLMCRTPLFKRVGTSSIRGNAVVTCAADGQWDFGDLRCEGPTCPDPGTFAGTQQVATSYEEFSTVRYTCTQQGFQVTNDLPLYCQFDPLTGGLAWNGTAPNCTDKQQPTFSNCPSSIRQVSYLSSAFFAEPVASDNVMVKELTITPNDYTVSTIIQTDLQVAYIARDHAGNIGSCVINIRVRDESPPHIRCNSSFEVQLFSENQFVKYDSVNFVVSRADNTGSIAMTYSVNPLIIDRYSVGETFTVKIDAADPSGNTDTCLVQVKVKAPLCVPWSLNVNNGSITCFQQNNNGYRCDIKCNTGYKFFDDPDADVVSRSCNPGGDWDQPAPVCTLAYYTNHRLSVQMIYRTRDSPTSTCQSNYVVQLNTKLPDLAKSLTSLCSGQSTPVTVSTAANINPVAVTSYNDGIYATFRLDMNSSPTSQSAINQCTSTVTSAFRSVSNSLQAIRTLSAQNNCAASEVVQFGSVLQNSINCNRNQQSRIEPSSGNFQCMACIPGYTSSIGTSCSKCSQGSYFDSKTGSCQFCPSGTRSQTLAARHISDCYLHCPYGYVSSTGMAPCSPCSEHTYSLNRTYCAPCSSGLFTRGDAQGFPASCRSPCQPGTFSFDGLSPCRPCPKGFFQSQAGASTCTECTSNATTTSINSTSVGDCQPAGPIVCSSNPCFKGSCIAVNHDYRCLCPAGYTGRNCQTAIGPCDSNPCFNSGACHNQGTDYDCHCTEPGTAGRNCELDKTNNCAASPCHNFGACQDRVLNHICLCPSFSNYTHSFGQPGGDCIQLRDPCQEDPCQNGASCVNLGNIRRKCQCADGYEGESCEIDKDYCASNPCQNGARCQDGPGSQVTCSCLPGYSGELCEVRQDQCIGKTCGQYSTCVDVYTSGKVECYCNQGFVSVNGVCQMVVVDACLSSPCENNSTCVRSGTHYQCFCKAGYTGANCQHNIDDCVTNPCLNGGTCQDLLNGFRCLCPSDTSAPTCQDAFDQCSNENNPCNRYGTARCIDYYRGYSCECLPGYYGVNCTEGQTNCNSFPCRHGGICQEYGNSYTCKCPDGFQGANCDYLRNFCASSPCANGGSCVNTDTGTLCKCKPGYRGDRCEIRYDLCTVANPCVVSGSACVTDSNNKISCSCPQGYTGPYCQNSTTSCQTTTCQNGGTCSDSGGVALCSCPAGFSGKLCEVNNDDCNPSPCPANSVCVDGVNSYSCVCADDKIGENCNKDLSLNFDLIVHPGATYPKSELFTWPLSSTAFTVATWVQFTERTSPGTLLALYGLNSDTAVANPQHLVRIDRQSATLEFSGTKALAFTSAIDDGFWHHIVVRWDGSSGQVTVYVDGTVSATTSPYGQGMRLTPYGWVVVGGTYDAVSGTIDRSGGMVGRLSRVHVGATLISNQDVSEMYANTNYVPNSSYRQLTKHLLNGTSAIVDYQSKLTQGVCLPSSQCRNIDQVLASPSVAQCPGNQMTESQRRSEPSWTIPSFQTNDPVGSNYVSGSTEMGWGHYGVAYTQSDSDGDTAVCSFLLDNRRGSCKNPVPPRFGSQSCVTTGAGIRCEVTCSRNYTRSRPEPLFYSCGTYGMFDSADRVMPFTYPSCTTCEKPKLNLAMKLNYTLSSVASCNSAQNNLMTNIRSSLNSLNTKWQQGLCGSGSCSAVLVTLDCPPATPLLTRVTVNLEPEELLRYNSVLRTVTEVLTIAVVDDNAFTYGGAVPDVTSLAFTRGMSCPTGKLLLDNCCVDCGLGHYFNTDTNGCSACPRGTYLDELGRTGTATSSPCRSCPSGTTTPSAGAESSSDCADQCQYGSYYNLTEAQCMLCPVGFYAENPGSFMCDACAFLETTAREGATASVSCAVNPISTTTARTTTAALPSVGASTEEDVMTWTEVALMVLGLIVLIVLIFLILFFCFRQHLVKWCPCLVTKVKPEDKTGWHYVDRFGETRMKFASYNLAEMRKSDRDLLEDSVEEGSVHTNISLQVPVFEEKLNGMVKKRSVHVSDHAADHTSEKKKERRRKKKRSRKNADPEGDRAKPEGSAAPPSATELPADSMIRRPPSAFNRPRPTLEEVPYENFVSQNVYENMESVSNPPRSPSTGRQTARIMIDSDEDER